MDSDLKETEGRGAEAASLDQTELSTSNGDSAGAHTEGRNVQFRSRKRARKTRVRRTLDAEENGADDNDGEEMSSSDLMLLRAAQRLREESRRTALDIRASKAPRIDKEKSEKDTNPTGDNVVVGLKEDFAVERSGHAMEERMENYINEGMKKKFGVPQDSADVSRTAGAIDENDLFAIPERLRVEERPLYDPGEGLPAAGVEEVELPEEVRLKNIQETLQAHKEIMSKREVRSNTTQAIETLPGNLSANFTKHRNDWIEEHLGPRTVAAPRGANTSTRDAANDTKDSRESAKPEGGRRPRYQAATDNLVVDRFKKRWRR